MTTGQPIPGSGKARAGKIANPPMPYRAKSVIRATAAAGSAGKQITMSLNPDCASAGSMAAISRSDPG
jgi:hypothetical protein